MTVLLLAGSTLAGGRPDKVKSWFGHVAGGYNVPSGDFSDVVDDGWEVNGGATFWPESWPVGINLDLAYSEFDLSDEVIQFINDNQPPAGGEITGGDTNIYSLSADIMWGPDTGKVGFYLMGGIGVDYLEAKLTTTGTVIYPPICGWWWCIPGGVGPGTVIAASADTTDFSANVGIGLTIELGLSGSQLLVEARYRRVETDPGPTEYIPITIGYRW